MKTLNIIGAVILYLFAQNGHAGSLTGTGVVESYQLSKASYQGSKRREYKVYVPRSYDRSQAVSMVFALHGCNMTHDDAINNWNWDLVADTHNFIVVFPFVTQFDEMRNSNCWGYWFDTHIEEGSGEVEDLHRMALAVERNYRIDPERRYIIGLSSGGGMSVAAAIAHNEYWAAAASAAGLPYGDWANSVLSETFKPVQQHIDAIRAELDDTRTIPFMVINSLNDETVRFKSAELLRDSHLSVFGGDGEAAASQDCSAEGIACTHNRYADDAAQTVVETVFYDGPVAGTQCGMLGCGHYYGGEDDDASAWALGTGPSTTQIAWDFFSRHTFSGNLEPQITIQSQVTADQEIVTTGSASDTDGTIASVLVMLLKRGEDGYQEILQVPVSGDFSDFSATSPVLADGVYKVFAKAIDDDDASADSTSPPLLVNITAHPPEVDVTAATVEQNNVTVTVSVSDPDGDLDRVWVTAGDVSVTAVQDNGAFQASFTHLAPGDHTAVATAIDLLEQTGSDTVAFFVEYEPPPSVTSTVQRHCEEGRIPWSAYSTYYLKYGMNEFTLYQMPDGTWRELPPDGDCVTATVADHVDAGRAYSAISGWWIFAQTTYFAEGSDDPLGVSAEASVSLQQSGAAHWEKVDHCP